jgi:hypothetical protein
MYTFDDYVEHVVELSEPDTAYSDTLGYGSWTMVYDEGIMVDFPDRQISLINYLMYTEGEVKGAYNSVCDKTMRGWYRGIEP